MFDIGIFAPFGTDHDRNIAYCRDAGASHIVLSTGNISSDDAPAADAAQDTRRSIRQCRSCAGRANSAAPQPRRLR